MGGVETLQPSPQQFPAPSAPLPLFSSDEVDLADVAQVALPALQKISSNEWQETLRNVAEISVTRLSGAMTNKVFECKWREPSGKSRRVLVRLYGSEVDTIFSREQEVETFERLSRHGYGPQLLARFPQGRVEEWLHARTLTAADLRDAACSCRIAAKLAEFHQLDMGPPRSATVWLRMRTWLGTALEAADPLVAAEFRLTELEDEIAELEQKLGAGQDARQAEGSRPAGDGGSREKGQARRGRQGAGGREEWPRGQGGEEQAAAESEAGRKRWGIGFCHNDLQYGNLMADERTGAITIIDYEYSGYNPIAFDIANHFCEFAADYHSDRPHLLDYSRYPTREERRRFCRAYLTAAGVDSSPDVVESLVKDVDRFTLVSHLHWALWGIIFSASSTIDFDYVDYARQRLRAYFMSKAGLLTADAQLPTVFASRT